MIGQFVYSEKLDPDGITIVLVTDTSGRAVADVLVPPVVAFVYRDLVQPTLLSSLSVESAMAYGIFLAMKARVSLLISGDRAGWQTSWGSLVERC